MRPIYALPFSLALLSALASPARADLVFETEPNDTLETANKTVGLNDISFEGYLTLGDVDTFTVRMIPDANGTVSLQQSVLWLGFSSAGNRYLNMRETQPPFNGITRIGTSGFADRVQTSNSSSFQQVPAVHTFQLWTTPTFPGSGPVTGSVFEGGYRITFLARNGTVIQGTSVPEPSAVLVGLAFVGSGFCLRRRKKGKH